jgi:hypothetical protein
MEYLLQSDVNRDRWLLPFVENKTHNPLYIITGNWKLETGNWYA